MRTALLSVVWVTAALYNAQPDPSPLHAAIAKGDAGEVKRLLAGGADPLGPADDKGLRPWQRVAGWLLTWRDEADRQKGLAMAQAFIEHATPKQLDEMNALHDLVRYDLAKEVVRLLERGANVNGRDAEGHAPLHVAVLYFRPQMVKLLLHHKAELNAPDDAGMTPLLHAVHLACRRSVHEGGMYLDKHAGGWRDRDKAALLDFSKLPAHKEAVEMLHLLLKLGADTERGGPQGVTPLHLAAGIEDPRQTAVVAGVDSFPGTMTFHGDATYSSSTWGYHGLEVVDLLLKAKAKVNAKTRFGLTPLDLAASAATRERLRKAGATTGLDQLPGVGNLVTANDLTALRKAKGKADLDAPHAGGFTPLTWALFHRQDEMVPVLLKLGADPSRRDGYGLSPLWLALGSKNLDGVAQLLAAGASADTPLGKEDARLHGGRSFPTTLKKGIRALAIAVLGDDPTGLPRPDLRLTRLLLAFDADANHPVDNSGNTALHHAASRVDADMIRLLVTHGAKRNVKNQHGEVPLDWLPKEAPAELRELLRGG